MTEMCLRCFYTSIPPVWLTSLIKVAGSGIATDLVPKVQQDTPLLDLANHASVHQDSASRLCPFSSVLAFVSQIELDAEALERMDEWTLQARAERDAITLEKDRLQVKLKTPTLVDVSRHIVCFLRLSLLSLVTSPPYRRSLLGCDPVSMVFAC